MTKCYPRWNRTWASHNLWFQVQHYPLYSNLTIACKTETLGSLYNHALLIPLKSSKSKYQVVHEQKFKDLLSSTCQVSVERIVLDLESEVMRGLGSIPTGRNILSLDFSHIVKPLMPILALLPMLCVCENPYWASCRTSFASSSPLHFMFPVSSNKKWLLASPTLIIQGFARPLHVLDDKITSYTYGATLCTEKQTENVTG